MRYSILKILFILLFLATINACEKENVIEEKTLVDTANKSASYTAIKRKMKSDLSGKTVKPRPPINIDYQILSTPELGQPLEIEITVSSTITDSPIDVNYRALHENALRFMPQNSGGQSFKLTNLRSPGKRKIVVVPQQAGRNLFTVTTLLQTADGVVANSRAIAIQVGNVPAVKRLNGELKQDEAGEMIISMPASSR